MIPLAAFSVVGCTTLPLVDRLHPANTEAPESLERPLHGLLTDDEHTQRTRELLARRDAQTRAAESESPTDQTNIAAPKDATKKW
jgi:hypothetical protein